MNFSRSFFELYGCGDLFDPRLMPYLKITGKRVIRVSVREAGSREIGPEHRAMAAECYHLIAMILIRAAENYLAKDSGSHRLRGIAATPVPPRSIRHAAELYGTFALYHKQRITTKTEV